MRRQFTRTAAVLLALAVGAGMLCACQSGGPPDAASPSPTPSPSPSPAEYMSTVAMRVGSVPVTAAEYNIYYTDMRNSLSATYQQAGKDTTTAAFTDDVLAQTLKTIRNTASLDAEAGKAGETLNADSRAKLADAMSGMEGDAKSRSLSLDAFLDASYGLGVDQALYRQHLTNTLLASQYLNEQTAKFRFAQSDYEAYYAQNKNKLDTVTFYYFKFSGTDAQANDFLSRVADKASFVQAAADFVEAKDKQYYLDNPDTTLVRQARLSDMPASAAAWLGGPSRKAGDKTVMQSDDHSAYQVFYFISRQRPEYHVVNMRCILFACKDDAGKNSFTPTAAQWADAKKKAQSELDKWKAGDATEDSFAALAKSDSEDASKNSGGLYQNLALGTLERPVDDWCFDASRKPGDTGIVKFSYGYYILYFVSKNDNPAWMDVVGAGLKNDRVDAFLGDLKKQYPVMTNSDGMNLTIPQTGGTGSSGAGS